MPLITIGIPVYKRLQYLDVALKSALNQSYKGIEILISQNLYSGAEANRIEEYSLNASRQYHNVRYIKQADNKGLSGNWNELVKHAKGEYIIIIGDDDVIPLGAISELLKYIEYQPAVVFGNQIFIDENGDQLSFDPNQRYHRNEIPDGLVSNVEKYIWTNSLPITGSLIKTDLLKKVLFNTELNTPEQEMFLRLFKINSQFYFTKEIVSYYRIHNRSETSNGLKYHLLLYYLINADCSKSNMVYKQLCISQRMVSGLLSALYYSDMDKFSFLINSEYLPRRKAEKILCTILKYTFFITRDSKRTYYLGRNYYNVGRRVLRMCSKKG